MSAMRSVMLTRVLLPRAATVANQAFLPVFSMQSRRMSIPRPAWDTDLKDLDPEVYKIIQMEQDRQHKGIALIPSENYTTHAVSQVESHAAHLQSFWLLEDFVPVSQRCFFYNLQALGSVMTNKYSEVHIPQSFV